MCIKIECPGQDIYWRLDHAMVQGNHASLKSRYTFIDKSCNQAEETLIETFTDGKSH